MLAASHGSRQGLAHIYDHHMLEDFSHTSIHDSVGSAVICDGASCCSKAAPIANALSKTIAHWLVKHFEEAVQSSPEALRRRICRLIRKEQYRLQSVLRCSIEDLGCTLVAAAIESGSGRYVAIQLGDGIIIGRDQSGALLRVTQPDQGQEDRATYLTCCDNETVFSHLQIVTGTSMAGLLCTSDGLEGLLYAANAPAVSTDCAKILQCPSEPWIVSTLLNNIEASDYVPLDDYSIAVVMAA